MDANNDYLHDFYMWGLPIFPTPRPDPVQFANPAAPTRAEIKAELKKVSHTIGTLVTKASRSLSLAHEAKLASSHRIEMLYILRAVSRDVGNPFPSDKRLHPKYRDRYPSIKHSNAPSEGISSGHQPTSPLPLVRKPRSKYVTPPPPPPDLYVHRPAPRPIPDKPGSSPPEALVTPIPDKPDHTPEAPDIINTSDSDCPPRPRNKQAPATPMTNYAADTEILSITSSDSEHSPGPQSDNHPAASDHATDSDNPDEGCTTQSEGPDDEVAEDSDMSTDSDGPDTGLAQLDEEDLSSDSDESMNSDDLLGDDGTYSEPGYEEVIPRSKTEFATRPASPHLMDV
ncbi:hypothetical protein CPC08DRAFT_769957 [Agrocybe pediades]|nr:hypothetical protein CPC08DRAFT_769957 [Agrocybe pediades]